MGNIDETKRVWQCNKCGKQIIIHRNELPPQQSGCSVTLIYHVWIMMTNK